MHRFTPNIRFRSGFVFLLCFWKGGFCEFKCTVLVKLVRAILDQVCSVHEILPLWSRTYQWTVKYNFLYGKINLDRILWHYCSMQFGSFIQNPVHEILPLSLYSKHLKRRRTYQWTVKYNFLYGKINLDRILWHYGSMQFGCFIQNPVQDTWATLLCELFRIESTVYFSQNLLWTCSSASLYSKHSVSFWVCLSVVFLKMRLLWVQMHCFGQVR